MTTTAPPALDDVLPAIADRERAEPETFPAASVASLYESGVVLGPLPVAVGGSGWRLADAVRATEAIAAASPSTALIASMPLGLAGIYGLGASAAPEVHRRVWSEQIDRVAADYRAGLIYAACNSEKGAGGSLAAMQTVATKAPDGAFRLTGEKILASSGRFAATFFSAGKVVPEDLPGAGIVEFFFVQTDAPGLEILDDWDGFGMRPTESHTVRYTEAPARELMGFPDFINVIQPLQYWFCLFAAIPLGCAKAILDASGKPAPQSPALRLRLSDAQMRYEAMRAYLLESAEDFEAGAGPSYANRVLRTKTYVTQEATKLCAELFALGGGRNYRRTSPVARMLADSFAGTSLRPPLALALDQLVEGFTLEAEE
ncbi:MAG: acyl-CoA dehydrogenase family protein [Tepidiformaceae bacterium]